MREKRIRKVQPGLREAAPYQDRSQCGFGGTRCSTNTEPMCCHYDGGAGQVLPSISQCYAPRAKLSPAKMQWIPHLHSLHSGCFPSIDFSSAFISAILHDHLLCVLWEIPSFWQKLLLNHIWVSGIFLNVGMRIMLLVCPLQRSQFTDMWKAYTARAASAWHVMRNPVLDQFRCSWSSIW